MITVQLDFFSIVIFLGLAQGLFLSILFLLKKGNYSQILGILILVLSIFIFDFHAAYTLLSLQYPHFIDISLTLGFATGPLLYIIYHYVINKKYPSKIAFHFIPFIMFTLYHCLYLFQSGVYKFNSFVKSRGLDEPLKSVVSNFPADPLGIRSEIGLISIIALLVYGLLIVYELFKFYKVNKEEFWKSTNSTLSWLKKLAVIFLLISIYSLADWFIYGDNPNSEYITAFFLTLVIYFISYEVISNTKLLNDKASLVKYEKSSLPSELKEQFKEKLLKYMAEHKPYLSNTFSLKKLAESLSTSTNNISQILNQDFQITYHEFVANYRIEQAKLYLVDLTFSEKTIEEISVMVGYNSKAAFNKAFKAKVEMTPLQFRKANQLKN